MWFEPGLSLVGGVSVGLIWAFCSSCQFHDVNFLDPRLSQGLMGVGLAALAAQAGLWASLNRRRSAQALNVLNVLTLLILSGGAILYLLALKLGVPRCWACGVFWLVQFILVWRLARREPSWVKVAPYYLVTLVIASGLLIQSPHASTILRELPIVARPSAVNLVGRSIEKVLPGLKNQEFVLAASCSACHQASLIKFAREAQSRGEVLTFVLSHETSNLQRKLAPHRTLVLNKQQLEKEWTPPSRPVLLKTQGYRIVESRGIK